MILFCQVNGPNPNPKAGQKVCDHENCIDAFDGHANCLCHMIVKSCKLSYQKLQRWGCSGPSDDPQAGNKIKLFFIQFIFIMEETIYAGPKYNQFNDGNKQLRNYLDCNLAFCHFFE